MSHFRAPAKFLCLHLREKCTMKFNIFLNYKPAQLCHNRKNLWECVPPVPPKETMISTWNNNAILSSEKESDISFIIFFKNPIYYPGLATTNNFS